MRDEDIEMVVEFRTRCGRCETSYRIQSVLLIPEPRCFQQSVRQMRKNLEDAPRKCCKRDLPVIGERWEDLWRGP